MEFSRQNYPWLNIYSNIFDGANQRNDIMSITTIQVIKEAAVQIIQGDYEASRQLHDVSGSGIESDEMRDLAETIGLMGVKVEAREYSLEQKIAELEVKNDLLAKAEKLKTISGFMFSAIVILLSVYTIILSQAFTYGWFQPSAKSIITFGLLIVMVVLITLFLTNYSYPIQHWGLTWKGSKRSLIESLVYTTPIAVFAIVLKLILMNTPSSALYGKPLLSWEFSSLQLLIYTVSSLAQEFICRGFIQTNVEQMLTGRYRSAIAIVTTSVLFGVVHLHYSTPTMVVTILGGIFFGWLYSRHRTLVGITIAHYILGILLFNLCLIG
jgi:membrane protease YdiL (CAAX protease family)